MDLNIILWIGGMLFSLGIFAVKVGFGLSFSRMKWKGMFFTLSIYFLIFILIAVLSEQLIRIFEPVLKRGAYLHALIATGMIMWGIHLLRRQNTEHRAQAKPKFNAQNSKIGDSELPTLNSLLLLVPCPVCLTAMTFSAWAALNVIKLPAYLVGSGLGAVFVTLSLAIYFFLKFITHNPSLMTQRMNLGLSMLAIGLYFIFSLHLPAKIEEAKDVYVSFLAQNNNAAINNNTDVFVVLFAAMLIGFFINKTQGVKG